jgi:hypothetical protein
MNYKTWVMISFYSLMIGWLPFMWFAEWASLNKEYGWYVFFVNLFFCMLGSFMMLPILRNHDLFKSIEELQEERARWYEARRKLEQKILNKILKENET